MNLLQCETKYAIMLVKNRLMSELLRDHKCLLQLFSRVQTNVDHHIPTPLQCTMNNSHLQTALHQKDMANTAKLFADSLTKNLIPVPEPFVFDENALE